MVIITPIEQFNLLKKQEYVDMQCIVCNNQFKLKKQAVVALQENKRKLHFTGNFCSRQCSGYSKRSRYTVNCSLCNIEFESTPKANQTFCSLKCATTYHNSKRRNNGYSHKYKGLKHTIPCNTCGINVLCGIYCYNVSCKSCRRLRNNEKYKIYVQNNQHSKSCIICGSIFYTHTTYKKTCSSTCRTKLIFTNRTYPGGKRHTYKYFCKLQGVDVTLHSSWELVCAQFLDSNNIGWLRPKPVNWFDHNKQSNRLYYPDFYLPKYNLYLDPKNPYCMIQDKDKMHAVSDKINVVYGDFDKIIQYIINLILD